MSGLMWIQINLELTLWMVFPEIFLNVNIIIKMIQFLLTFSLLAVTCRLLITFANSLDPDQDRQNVSPDLDPNCFTLIVFLEYILKVNFERKSADYKHEKLPSMQRVNKEIFHMPKFSIWMYDRRMSFYEEDRVCVNLVFSSYGSQFWT